MHTVELTGDMIQTARNWMMARTGSDFPYLAMPANGLAACGDDGELLACVTVFADRYRPVAFCGWALANPNNLPIVSRKALQAIFVELPEYVDRKLHCRWLITCFGHSGINRMLDSLGYAAGDVRAEHRIIYIGG